jgi:hypothetical protein
MLTANGVSFPEASFSTSLDLCGIMDRSILHLPAGGHVSIRFESGHWVLPCATMTWVKQQGLDARAALP